MKSKFVNLKYYAWIVVGLLWVVALLNYLDRLLIASMRDPIMVLFGPARGFLDSNLMPIMCQVINKKYRATGYGFLNFISTTIGGIMVYAGGALKDANVSLSLVFQASAVVLLIASWTLLFVKPKIES